MAACAAVVGKDNAPKFFCCLNPEDNLKLQYKTFAALDIIEERMNPKFKPDDVRESFLGHLYHLENYKTFGYITSTRVKFIIIVDSSNIRIRENEIRTMFRKIHSEYADVVSNPFYTPGEQILSKKFATNVRNIISGSS